MFLKISEHLICLSDCVYVKRNGSELCFTFKNQAIVSVTFRCVENADAVFEAVAKHIAQPNVTVIVRELSVEGRDAIDIVVEK